MTELSPELEAEILADLDGRRGALGEEAARKFLADHGLTVVDTVADQEAADRETFAAELQRMRDYIGRDLTVQEEERLIDAVPSQGAIPDLVERFGDEMKGRATSGQQDRRELMLEVAESVSDDDTGEDEFEQTPAPADETPDGRRARMLAAAGRVDDEGGD